MAEMKHKKRGSMPLLLILLVALIGATVALFMWPTEEAKPKAEPATESNEAEQRSAEDDVEATTLIHAGDTAPDFTVQMLDGRRVALAENDGKPTLLIFWATWCPPCREELAHLQEGIIDVYGDKLRVLPISRGEKREVVEEFINTMGYTFAVGLDSDQAAYNKYASNYIPRCFVIDAKGGVVYAGVGYDETVAGEVKAAIDKTLEAAE